MPERRTAGPSDSIAYTTMQNCDQLTADTDSVEGDSQCSCGEQLKKVIHDMYMCDGGIRLLFTRIRELCERLESVEQSVCYLLNQVETLKARSNSPGAE